MRKRFGKQRVVAWAMATTLALSVVNVPAVSNWRVPMATVEAAIWEQNDKVTTNAIDCSELTQEDWNTSATKASYSVEGNGDSLAAGTKVTFTITISNEEYETLGENGFLKLQAVIQQEATWNESTVVKMGWPTYGPAGDNAFVQNEDGSWSADIAFEMANGVDMFHSLLIDAVGVKFVGDIDISNIKIKDANEIWSNVGAESNAVEFGTAEDWNTWDNTLKATFEGTGEEVPKDSVMKFNMTISEEAYNTMSETDYIKVQAVYFNEDNNWDTVLKLGYPQYDPSTFTQNEDGSYSAEVQLTFAEKLPNFASVLIQGVGTGFAGTVSFSDVTITKPSVVELTPQEATVIADFAEGIGDWAGEAGWDYSHGKEEPTKDAAGNKVEAAEAEWDEASQQLKMILDYSADTASGWSEAKVSGTFEPVNVGNYNMISFRLTYPSDMESVRTKLFMTSTDGKTEILNAEGSFRAKTVEDLGNGWSTATIRGTFSPKNVDVSKFTIGIVGPYKDLDYVLIDDVKIGQLDASEDYVKITETVETEVDAADISKMATSVKLVDEDATDSTKSLAAYLKGLQASDQVLFGHQNSTFRSVRTNGEISDIKDITGAEAGLFGIDSLALTGVESGGTTRQEALDNSIAATKKAYEAGSIVTLSCHMPNFTNSKIKKTEDGYDFTTCDFMESKDLTPCADYVLEGGEYNAVFNAYLDIIVDYAKALEKDNIPVLFRPFHENSGNWFWWGTSTSEESYKAMWRYMVSYLEAKGVNNFLYVYSPNGPFSTADQYLDRYPGDEYVDIIAFDYYDDYADVNTYTGDKFFDAFAETCSVVAQIAEEKGKIPAIAETGIRITGAGKDSLMVTGNPTTGHDWYNQVIDTAAANNIPYFLLWANFEEANFFVPYKYNDELGQEMINEFIKAYNNDKSIFGNGTNFYGENGAVSKANTIEVDSYDNATGYMITPKNYAVIKTVEDSTMQASVVNADSVTFKVYAAPDSDPIDIVGTKVDNSNMYTAKLSEEQLSSLGETGIGVVEVVALGNDEKTVTIGNASFINFNQDAPVMPAHVFDNYEYYYGSDGLLQNKYGSHNSAANCSSSVRLDGENKSAGDYGMAFNYTLAYRGSEVWTGGLGRAFEDTDFSEYNALSMWVKPDGNGQKMVVQLVDGAGAEYECHLTELMKTQEEQNITIPFTSFIKKGTTDVSIDPSSIAAFRLWCNSIPDNYTGNKDDDGNYTVNGTIYFDEMEAVSVSEEDLSAAQKVIDKINALDPADLEQFETNKNDVEKEYDGLTDAQKSIAVLTYSKLAGIEAIYEKHKKVQPAKSAIEAIGDVEYTDECKTKIDAARTAYNELDDELKTYIPEDVYTVLTDAEQKYEDLGEVVKFKEKLEDIGDLEEVVYSSECKTKIDAARTAYDALTEDQKRLVDEEDYELLTKVEEQYASLEEVENVRMLINAIGEVSFSADSITKIEAARTAYDALDETQKALINESELKVLTDAETKYAELDKEATDLEKAQIVKELIKSVTNVSYTDECKVKIDAARKAYDALTEEQKKLVDDETLKVLTDAETKYADLKKADDDAKKAAEEAEEKKAENKKQADAVKELIAAIGTVDASDECKAKIEAAKVAYNALTEEQKALISADELKVLTDAETKHMELADAALIGTSVKAKDGSATYKITAAANGEVEVSYTKPATKKTTVTIPATVTLEDGTVAKVTSIEAKAFYKNTKVKTVTIGNNVKSIGKQAFDKCSKLTTVKNGKNVEKIETNAFANCKKLKNISLSSNLTTIGTKAFYKCISLKKITIHAKVNKIGKQAFYGCKSLKTITIKTTKLTKKNVGKNAFKGIHSKAKIKVPSKKYKTYKSLLKSKGAGKNVKYTK